MYFEFEKEMEKLKLLKPNKRMVLAVSGGVDSIVLFHLIQKLPSPKRPAVTVAHVNHHLRPESDAEEAFVKELVKSRQLPFYVYHWPRREHPDSGIEEAARNRRYTFFKEVMDQTDSEILMTAHHQDDQVETILMKLTRGSSLEQMTGIDAIQNFHGGSLIRPLLPFSKEEIYQYAHDHQIRYVEDPSNQELDYSRNRFRNQIIPLFKEENEKFNEHIERFAFDLKDLIAIAKPSIKKSFEELVTIKPNKIEFNLKPFYNYSKPVQRAVLIEILNHLYKNKSTTYKTSYIDILENWLQNATGNTQLHLTEDINVTKSYDEIIFEQSSVHADIPASKQNETNHTLDKHQTLIRLSPSETLEFLHYKQLDEDTLEKLQKDSEDLLVFHSDHVSFPLTIRHRQPGDRMTYKGLNGTKKIKDIFIDEKVPLEARDKAWVVEDANGIIIWLISHRKMDLLSARETDKLTYVLKYTKYNSEEY